MWLQSSPAFQKAVVTGPPHTAVPIGQQTPALAPPPNPHLPLLSASLCGVPSSPLPLCSDGPPILLAFLYTAFRSQVSPSGIVSRYLSLYLSWCLAAHHRVLPGTSSSLHLCQALFSSLYTFLPSNPSPFSPFSFLFLLLNRLLHQTKYILKIFVK